MNPLVQIYQKENDPAVEITEKMQASVNSRKRASCSKSAAHLICCNAINKRMSGCVGIACSRLMTTPCCKLSTTWSKLIVKTFYPQGWGMLFQQIKLQPVAVPGLGIWGRGVGVIWEATHIFSGGEQDRFHEISPPPLPKFSIECCFCLIWQFRFEL